MHNVVANNLPVTLPLAHLHGDAHPSRRCRKADLITDRDTREIVCWSLFNLAISSPPFLPS